MGCDANGPAQLTSDSPAQGNAPTQRSPWENLPCLSRQHHHLVQLPGRTQDKCEPCTRCITKSRAFLLTKEILIIHNKNWFSGTSHLCRGNRGRPIKSGPNPQLASTAISQTCMPILRACAIHCILPPFPCQTHHSAYTIDMKGIQQHISSIDLWAPNGIREHQMSSGGQRLFNNNRPQRSRQQQDFCHLQCQQVSNRHSSIIWHFMGKLPTSGFWKQTTEPSTLRSSA